MYIHSDYYVQNKLNYLINNFLRIIQILIDQMQKVTNPILN